MAKIVGMFFSTIKKKLTELWTSSLFALLILCRHCQKYEYIYYIQLVIEFMLVTVMLITNYGGIIIALIVTM